MKAFDFKIDTDSPIYVKKHTRHFLNLDIPDTYMKVNDEWVWIVDRRYGVLTLPYCDLSVSDRKRVLDFLVASTIAYYKWSYTWETRQHVSHNLAEDVNRFIEGFYRDTFSDSLMEELREIGYKPLKGAHHAI